MTLLFHRPGEMKFTLSNAVWFGVTLVSAGLALISYRYVAQKGFVPPTVAQNRFFHPWLMFHAGGAGTALLLGPFQFLPAWRRRWPKAHRWTGRAYLVSCLVGGVSGLVLAAGASTGPIAQTGFAVVCVLWIYGTGQAWRAALSRSWAEHRRWMIRSFALTFAAVTLRVDLQIASALGFSLLNSYRAIAWLSWVPNAVWAEFYVRRGEVPRSKADAPTHLSGLPIAAHKP